MGRVTLLLSALCVPAYARRKLPDELTSTAASALIQAERSSEEFPVSRTLNILGLPIGLLANIKSPMGKQVHRVDAWHREGVGPLSAGVATWEEDQPPGGRKRDDDGGKGAGKGDGSGAGGPSYTGGGGGRGSYGGGGGGDMRNFDDEEDYEDKLGMVKAKDQSGRTIDLTVPIDWEDRLDGVQIRKVAERTFEEVYETGLPSSSTWPVMLKVMDSDLGDSRREVLVGMRLKAFRSIGRCNRGKILRYIDGDTIGEFSYALVEAETQTLASFMSVNIRRVESGTMDKTQMIVSPEESLPIMSSLLNSLLDLEEAGLLHGAVTPANIIYSRGEMALGGLGSVCLTSDGDYTLSCSAVRTKGRWTPGDPLWQPPEVEDGVPKGPKDHVWQAGLLLAAMCIGSNPLEDAIRARRSKIDKDTMVQDAWRKLRMGAWERFATEQYVVLGKIPTDIRQLIFNMLAPNPEKRITTEEALASVARIANERGIDLEGGSGGSEASASASAPSPAAYQASSSAVDPWSEEGAWQ